MPLRYVGREGVFHGKTLFEIARNLKNFGRGRIVYRQEFAKRYPDEGPSYYTLIAVRPEMNIDVLKGYGAGSATGYKVWKGNSMGKCVINAGAKQDWQLVPKDEEHLYTSIKEEAERPGINVIPNNLRLPPMMEMVFKEELTAEGMNFDDSTFLCRRKIKNTRFNMSAKLDDDSDKSDASSSVTVFPSTSV